MSYVHNITEIISKYKTSTVIQSHIIFVVVAKFADVTNNFACKYSCQIRSEYLLISSMVREKEKKALMFLPVIPSQ